MADNVQVTVNSQLLKIVDDLKKIEEQGKAVQKQLSDVAEGVGDSTKKNAKDVEGALTKMLNVGRRVANSLKQDFRALLSINALGGALKLSEQFRGSIKETLSLNDTIRRLGGTLGVAQNNFASFQAKMTKGLGEIGLSSDVAARALEGLAQTNVRGEEALLAYSKAAGQLASIGGQKGQEGNIAGGIARVITARGGNASDTSQMKTVAEDIRKASQVTGAKPTEILSSMESMFTTMSADFRKTIGTGGLSKLAAAGQVAGPNATKFLEDYLGKSPIARQALDAQGFKGVVTDKGIDVEKFRAASKDILARVGGDPRLAAQTLGLSEEAAEGFIRLSESLDKVKSAQDAITSSTGSLDDTYKKTLGAGDAFRANINRVKGMIAGPLSGITQGGTDALAGASESNAGALATVAGGGLLAAVLAGKGLKGIGGGLLGGEMKSQAIEAITGEKVQKVEVINWPNGFGMGGAGGGAAGLPGMLGKAGAVGGVAVGAYAAGSAINSVIDSTTQGKSADNAYEGNAIERLIYKLDKLTGGANAKAIQKAQIEVELKSKDVKETKRPGRGASN